MAIINLPSQAFLRQCFSYEPSTGVLTWKVRPREHFSAEGPWKTWNKRFADTIAGSPIGSGHWLVGICGRLMLCHRVIWKLETGNEPSEIDHINGVRDDNRWGNLRLCNQTQNIWNRKLGRNAAGIRGVRYHKIAGAWEARIRANGVKYRLGLFPTPEEAATARREAELRLFGEFAHDDR